MDALFKVTAAIERRRVDEAGRLVRYFEVHYETAHGAIGTVEIPVDEFSAEKVAEVITPIASELEAAFEMSEE